MAEPTPPHDAPRWLVGDWSPWLRDPADVVRLSFAVGGVVTLALGEYEQALRLFLTFLVSFVPRLLSAPRPFDFAFGVGMSLQAWGNLAHAFNGQPYDKVVHFVLPCAVAMLAYIGLMRARILPELEHERRIHRWVGIVVIAFAVGFAVGGAYEMYEWFAIHMFGAHLRVGYGDSIGDMADNGAGALVGGLLLVLWDRKGWATHRRVPGATLHHLAAGERKPDWFERVGTSLLSKTFPAGGGATSAGAALRSGAGRLRELHAPRLLAGDWSRVIRDPIDLVRASFLVGLIYALAVGRSEMALRFGVTLAVVLVVRALEAPRLFDFAFCAAMALQAWGDAARAFSGVNDYDALVQTVVTLAFAALLYLLLVRSSVLPELAEERGIHRRLAVFVAAACLGYSVAIFYELYVWVANHALGADYHVTYNGLIGRLAFDFVGACIGGALMLLWDRYGWGTRRRVPAAMLASR